MVRLLHPLGHVGRVVAGTRRRDALLASHTVGTGWMIGCEAIAEQRDINPHDESTHKPASNSAAHGDDGVVADECLSVSLRSLLAA